MYTTISVKQFLHETEENDYLGQCKYASLHDIKINQSNSLTPEGLSKRWNIVLKTATQTLKATTNKFIRTTGLPTKRLKTDKFQLCYNQLFFHYGIFYVDYLKVFP